MVLLFMKMEALLYKISPKGMERRSCIRHSGACFWRNPVMQVRSRQIAALHSSEGCFVLWARQEVLRSMRAKASWRGPRPCGSVALDLLRFNSNGRYPACCFISSRADSFHGCCHVFRSQIHRPLQQQPKQRNTEEFAQFLGSAIIYLVRDFALLEEYQCYFYVLGVYKSDGFLGREQVSWQPGR